MPELPEVETIRRVLQDVLPGRRIQGVDLRKLKMLRGYPRDAFVSGLQQRTIVNIERRGKFLLLRLDRKALVVHLGMTGQIFACAEGECSPRLETLHLPDKHTHLILDLSENTRLYFRDMRMFGRYALLDKEAEAPLFARLGPEPLDPGFSARRLHEKTRGRNISVKAFLLDQKTVAGVGNIYADESLFRAGLLPQTAASRLTADQVKTLHRSLRKVLREAIFSGGTTLSDYLDPRHQKGSFQWKLHVYGRAGESCYRCGSAIVKSVVAQRGTHWCPKCQR
jgi:formamidopyrimidine-DNA glycosylase